MPDGDPTVAGYTEPAGGGNRKLDGELAQDEAAVRQRTSDPAAHAKLDEIIARLPSSLDGGAMTVADAFTADEALASQAGAGAVLTFIFAAARDLIWIRCQGGTGFAKVTGTPGDGDGIYCEDGVPQPVTVRATEIKVWAPANCTVYVWGYGG